MSKIGIFMANGCEEIEGLTVVDLMRRAGIEIIMISITDQKQVTGSHGISFLADALSTDVSYDTLDGIVLPGGLTGTQNLGKDETVNRVIRTFADKGKLVAAICAAPSLLGAAGILNGKEAACYPGFEDKLTGAKISTDEVCVSENIITSRGMGTAIAFSLAIAAYLQDQAAADKLAKTIIYNLK